jgi:hypothetical protein
VHARSLWLTLLVAIAWSAPARAQDRFEIQVYDSETAPPGAFGLETHVNVAASGTTLSEGTELPTNHVGHLTFEPHIGLASWCEGGAYLQFAIRPDEPAAGFDYAGVKLRWKIRIPRRIRGFGFALNFELSSVPRIFEAPGLGSELRPIIDFLWKGIWIAVNPIVAIDFFGPDAGLPQLQPAAAFMVDVVRPFAVGVEWYGGFGPINRPLPVSDQVEKLFGVVTWQRAWFGINAGVGYGFSGGEKVIVKTILSFDIDAALHHPG